MYMPIERPGPGQESVWDYPRPPLVQPSSHHIEVIFAGTKIADSRRTLRILETSHPPVYYIPLRDIMPEVLEASSRVSYCEFKGEARYYRVRVGDTVAEDAAWTYETPAYGYEELADHVAFYPQLMDECRVDGEVALPQPGRFYGGWITSDIVGPFKGDPGIDVF